MKQRKRRWSFGAVTALALTVFTGYALLDTFVIPRSYGAVPQTVDVAAEEVQAAMEDSITVELTEYRENGTTIYVADVWVTDPSQLQTAFADGTYGKNVKDATSDIAETWTRSWPSTGTSTAPETAAM